nr:condensation domain-containing protein [Bacillus pumilus]
MTLLTAFSTLSHRLSSQDEFVIGSVIAGRNRTEMEHLIGFFVNTLALRIDHSGNPAFTELLERVKETTMGAYAHQDVPFEMVVDELNIVREAGKRDRCFRSCSFCKTYRLKLLRWGRRHPF